MGNETDRPAPLSYAVTDGGMVDAPWLRLVRFPRIPALLIALVTMAAIHLLYALFPDHFRTIRTPHLILIIISCFLPIAVQRPGIRRLAASLILCAVLLVIASFEERIPMDWEPKDGVLHFLVALSVVVCWQPKLGHELVSILPRAVFLVAGLAGMMETLKDFLWATALSERFPYTVEFLPGYLFVLALWFGIGWIERATKQAKSRWRDRMVIACLTACLVTVLAYFAFLQVELASYSLRAGRPFHRFYSLEILLYHKVDDSKLWDLLEHSNWKEDQSGTVAEDWRKTAIRYLALRDPSTPDRLSKILHLAPTAHLADACADQLVAGRRYECLPILTRYAIFGHSNACADALAKASIPQAAWPLFVNEIHFQMSIGDYPLLVMPETRTRLIALLGSDRGEDANLWVDLLNERGHGHHWPVPDSVLDEVDHVIDIYERFAAADNRLWRSKLSLPPGILRPSADVPDMATLESDLERYVHAVDQLVPETQPASQGH